MKCSKCKYLRDNYERQIPVLGTAMDIFIDPRICTNKESPHYLERMNTIYDDNYRGIGCIEGEPYEEI